MKRPAKIILIVVGVLVLVTILFLGFLGYIPGLSNLLGANKPRDLGIRYTKADFDFARAKSQIEYTILPANTPDNLSIQSSGTRPVNTSWDSKEISSLLNDRPWKYWPMKNVQLKINNDGTLEMSGNLIRDRLKGCGAGIGAPAVVADKAATLLPASPAFYIKAKPTLVDNKVGAFDIQSVTLGKMPISPNILLSHLDPNYIESAIAVDGVTSELGKYSGKKGAIVNFINNRLTQITGFYAKSAYFKNGKLFFDGNLSEKEMTVR